MLPVTRVNVLAELVHSRNPVIVKKLTSLLLVACLAAGCTHSLKITNTKKLTAPNVRPQRPVKVGFSTVVNDRLLSAAIKHAKANQAIADAREDFKPGGDFRPDYVVDLSRDTKFKASGQNFFITFPGFIIFTHAIVGYKYTAEITTHSTLRGTDGQTISQNDIATPFDFRHCSFARGAAAGCCGWLVPGYGAAAIIPGAIFAASYDKRATSEFIEKVEQPYGSYVSGKILEQLSQAQDGQTKTTQPSTTRFETMPLAGEPSRAKATDAAEQKYVVFFMKRTGNEIGEPVVSIREVPDFAHETLARMSNTGTVPNADAFEDVLLALGASPGEYFGQLNCANVFTQVEDQFVQLKKPRH